MRKILILEDGSIYEGDGFGSDEECFAELVFNTSMTGYQEILSDPSYCGQIVVMTYPLIGNYGMNDDDYECSRPSVSGLVVKEYCDLPSNFRSVETLGDVMRRFHISGISGIDTRKLTRHIRDHGSLRSALVHADADAAEVLERLNAWEYRTDHVSRVGTAHIYEYVPDQFMETRYHVAAIDCGMKQNILRELAANGCMVTVFPWNTPPGDILKIHPDGVFISNGPGNPEDVPETIDTVRQLAGRLPIFGICLGHQIISLAFGASVYKLKFGHRGGNHPVRNLLNGKVDITSQNHSYAVDRRSLRTTRLIETHVNLLDGTVEGVRSLEDHVVGIQYHPEGAPGPGDSRHLFNEFTDMMDRYAEGRANA